MKKTLLSLIVLTITLVSFSQKEEEDKIEKLRIAFLTEELDLSVEDAQKFWPIYNDHQTIKKQIDSETKAMMKKMKRLEKPNDAVVRQSIDEMSDLKLSGVKSEIEYLTQSLEVLGGEKTLKLIYSEKEFRRRVLKRLRESRREQDPNDREGEKRPKEPARK